MPLRADTREGDVASIWADLKARANEARRSFGAGEITEAVFRAKLYGLGFRGREITAEVNNKGMKL